MIESLEFANFRSWDRFPETGLKKITAFFGTNSSGKTSILGMLLLIKQTLESSDRSQVLNIGGENDYIQLGSYGDLVYGHDQQKSLKIKFNLKFLKGIVINDPEKRKELLLKGDRLSFETDIHQTSLKKLYVQGFSYTFANNTFTFRKKERDRYDYSLIAKSAGDSAKVKIRRTTGRVWPLPEPIKFHGFPDQIRTYYQNAGFLFDLQLAIEEFFSRVYYLGPLREYPQRQYTWTGAQPADVGQRGEKFIDALLSSRMQGLKIDPGYKYKKIPVENYVASWLKKLGLIESFAIDEIADGSNIYQVKVKKNRSSSEVLITDVGFGVSQILPILTLCFYVKEGSTLLIEQPEIHLHPKVQSGLADVFIDAVKKKNIQIIIESHSEYLLKRLQRRIAEEELSNERIASFFCTNDGEHSILKKLDVDMFGNIGNWPAGFFGDEMAEMAAMTKAIRKRNK